MAIIIYKNPAAVHKDVNPPVPPTGIYRHQLTSRLLSATLPGCIQKIISRIQEYTIEELSGKGKDGVKKYNMLPKLRKYAHYKTRLTLCIPALQGLQPTVSGETIF